jgi:murein DD-endopeptidase MepM/ murein hydrolase activator NlpD
VTGTLVALALVVGGFILLGGGPPGGARPQSHPSTDLLLGPPLEANGTPRVTPHGHYGAFRDGPPIHTHQGVDLAAPPGSAVLAVGDGTIVATDPGLGKVVRKLKLDRPGVWPDNAAGPLVTHAVYADLGPTLVEPGARVRKGQAIARVAKAGFVHFAVKSTTAGREEFFDSARAGFRYQDPNRAVA